MARISTLNSFKETMFWVHRSMCYEFCYGFYVRI